MCQCLQAISVKETNRFYFYKQALSSYISADTVSVLLEPRHPLSPVEDPVGLGVLLALTLGVPALAPDAADDEGAGGVEAEPLVSPLRSHGELRTPGTSSLVMVQSGLGRPDVERVVARAGWESRLGAQVGLAICWNIQSVTVWLTALWPVFLFFYLKNIKIAASISYYVNTEEGNYEIV